MRLAELTEMAIKGGGLSTQADEWAMRNKSYLEDSKHVGDIEEFQVKKKGLLYSLWNGSDLVALMKVDSIPNAYTVVDDWWVSSENRGQKIISKMLWFLKSRVGHSKLLLGKVHSDDTVNLLKAGGLSRFKKYWFDNTTGETEDFDVDTVDEFYTAKKQKWSLMLESQDDLNNMPRFNDPEAGFISQSYDWQIK